jgi:transcriptional regulator with XRE-family HTH domain
MSVEDSNELDFSIIRNLRVIEGLTIKDMALKTGLTNSTITRIETNQCNPTASTLASIGRVLRKRPSELVRLAEGVYVNQVKADVIDFPTPNTKKVSFPEIVLFLVNRLKGGVTISPPLMHADVYEIFIIQSGKVCIRIHERSFILEEGDVIRFDGIFTHTVEAIEDASYIVVQLKK